MAQKQQSLNGHHKPIIGERLKQYLDQLPTNLSEDDLNRIRDLAILYTMCRPLRNVTVAEAIRRISTVQKRSADLLKALQSLDRYKVNARQVLFDASHWHAGSKRSSSAIKRRTFVENALPECLSALEMATQSALQKLNALTVDREDLKEPEKAKGGSLYYKGSPDWFVSKCKILFEDITGERATKTKNGRFHCFAKTVSKIAGFHEDLWSAVRKALSKRQR